MKTLAILTLVFSALMAHAQERSTIPELEIGGWYSDAELEYLAKNSCSDWKQSSKTIQSHFAARKEIPVRHQISLPDPKKWKKMKPEDAQAQLHRALEIVRQDPTACLPREKSAVRSYVRAALRAASSLMEIDRYDGPETVDNTLRSLKRLAEEARKAMTDPASRARDIEELSLRFTRPVGKMECYESRERYDNIFLRGYLEYGAPDGRLILCRASRQYEAGIEGQGNDTYTETTSLLFLDFFKGNKKLFKSYPGSAVLDFDVSSRLSGRESL